MKKRSWGGPLATRVPCNPETSVGFQAVLVEPASLHLHVAEPVRRSARGITLAVMTGQYCMTSSPFYVDNYFLLCKLGNRCMDDRIIYMYKSMMGFCTEECRHEYFLEYRYRLAMAMEAESRRTRSEAVLVAKGEATISYSCIFFPCAEVERFP